MMSRQSLMRVAKRGRPVESRPAVGGPKPAHPSALEGRSPNNSNEAFLREAPSIAAHSAALRHGMEARRAETARGFDARQPGAEGGRPPLRCTVMPCGL
jgi:hypothetical protein